MLVGLPLAVAACSKWTRPVAEELAASQRAGLLAPDLLGAAVLLALAAASWRRSGSRRWLALPALTLAAALQLLASAYLVTVGEHAAWGDLVDGIRRRGDLTRVLADLVSPGALLAVAASAAVLGLVGWSAWRVGERAVRPPALAAAVLSSAGLALSLLPEPARLEHAELGRSGLWQLVGTVGATAPARGEAMRWPERWVDESSVEALRRAIDGAGEPPPPNLLVVVLESTGWSATSLGATAPPPSPSHPAPTPHLGALAARGVSFEQVRTVLPHTTKALFALLCGRYPAMQVDLWETSAAGDLDCLADVLGRAGYETVFAQTAFGGFEQRPRLVRNFGFGEFAAWEQIGGERLSYFASDDRSLEEWFEAWLDERDAGEERRPFFATLLTSGPHHAYELPFALRPEGRRPAHWRHARLLELQDGMLGAVLDLLALRGLLASTLVVAVGDHGEGFGEHGVMQHDNVFYDEALRVPMVLAGPGVPSGVRRGDLASVLDLMPLLAGRLGLRQDAVGGERLPGRDLLAVGERADAGRHYYGCLHAETCSGLVDGRVKLVRRPRQAVSFGFDLELDPGERSALTLAELQRRHPRLAGAEDDLQGWLAASRASRGPDFSSTPERLYGDWLCDDGSTCRHPRAHREADRYGFDELP
ncbi:MAG: hypothetical protein DWQ30_00390 [Acidobacteria bacterium]|nr:MAG: hypothetical protein DWQ30_00390 [Acidobacteriota bacterium]